MIKKLPLIFFNLLFLSFHFINAQKHQRSDTARLISEHNKMRNDVDNVTHTVHKSQNNFTYSFINSLELGVAQALANIIITTAFNWGSYGVKKVYHKATGAIDLEEIQHKQGLLKIDQALQNNQQQLISNDIEALNTLRKLMGNCSPQRKALLQERYDNALEKTLENFAGYQETVKSAPLPATRFIQDPQLLNAPNPALSQLGLNDIPELAGSQDHDDEELDDSDDEN